MLFAVSFAFTCQFSPSPWPWPQAKLQPWICYRRELPCPLMATRATHLPWLQAAQKPWICCLTQLPCPWMETRATHRTLLRAAPQRPSTSQLLSAKALANLHLSLSLWPWHPWVHFPWVQRPPSALLLQPHVLLLSCPNDPRQDRPRQDPLTEPLLLSERLFLPSPRQRAQDQQWKSPRCPLAASSAPPPCLLARTLSTVSKRPRQWYPCSPPLWAQSQRLLPPAQPG
mmetsp:Transcript_45662/g.121115  ORF Transcript_45662/g.121115 Transcript_45662/m.121115 type:complete len:228 (-) Transcript_45662:2193-2876(-)